MRLDQYPAKLGGALTGKRSSLESQIDQRIAEGAVDGKLTGTGCQRLQVTLNGAQIAADYRPGERGGDAERLQIAHGSLEQGQQRPHGLWAWNSQCLPQIRRGCHQSDS